MKRSSLCNESFRLQFRGAMLDVRRMDSVDAICEFTDAIAAAGYNTLMLYLEGRIKTPSFPYPAEGEYYTGEEMQHVVAHAAARNIEVIPGLQVLGHAEHFLQYQEMEHLAEVRGDATSLLGGNAKDVFCPSLPETMQFVNAYLTEMAAIFPARYFHLGSDEIWDLGRCELCRERLRRGETVDDLFVKHLTAVHEFVRDVLGREMIIWDDMFENYLTALERLPREVILCCWNYNRSFNLPPAHFRSRREEDRFALYDRLGFRYLFAPASFTYPSANVECFTRYARTHRPLGGLFCVWQKPQSFREDLPLLHYVGELWSGQPRPLEEVAAAFFGCDDPLFLAALRAVWESRCVEPTRLSVMSYLTGPLSELEALEQGAAQLQAGVLRQFAGACREGVARRTLDEILLGLEWKLIMYAVREVVEEIFTIGAPRPEPARVEERLASVTGRIERYTAQRAAMLTGQRPARHVTEVTERLAAFVRDLKELPTKAAGIAGLCRVKFFLPDQFNCPFSSFTIAFDDGSTERVASGVYKSHDLINPYFQHSFPYGRHRRPTAVHIESWLYGGMGVTYLDLLTPAGSFVPDTIREVAGNVRTPWHLLVDDRRDCFMGETDMDELHRNPELTRRRHGVTLTLVESKR